MKKVAALVGLFAFHNALALAQGPTLCVGPVARTTGDRGVVTRLDDRRQGQTRQDGVLRFRIDDGDKVTPDRLRFTPVIVPPRPGSHVFSVYEDDRRISSFKFSMTAGEAKCVRFDPFYETWRVSAATSVAACGCKR